MGVGFASSLGVEGAWERERERWRVQGALVGPLWF